VCCIRRIYAEEEKDVPVLDRKISPEDYGDRGRLFTLRGPNIEIHQCDSEIPTRNSKRRTMHLLFFFRNLIDFFQEPKK
jgi:hypothetical protein